MNSTKSKRLTTEEFIEKAQSNYGDKYTYTKVAYVNNRTKVCIICPIHGDFEVILNNFLRGHEYPGCNKGNSIFALYISLI